jgi:hypothetical protein
VENISVIENLLSEEWLEKSFCKNSTIPLLMTFDSLGKPMCCPLSMRCVLFNTIISISY